MKCKIGLVTCVLVVVAVRVDGASLYFNNAWTARIHRYDLDGSAPATVIDFGILPPTGDGLQAIEIDAAGGKMYWADAATHKIRRANLNGTGREDLFTSPSSEFGPIDLALNLEQGRIFFSDTSAGVIRSMNLNGSDVRDVITGLDDPIALAIDTVQDKLYWSDDMQTIRRANLDSTGIETAINQVTTQVKDIVLDAQEGKIYWTASTVESTIRRANLDGTMNEALHHGGLQMNFWGLALDMKAGHIYWSDVRSTLRIGRMNLDGSNKAILLTSAEVDPSNIRGIAVGPVPEPSTIALLICGVLGILPRWQRMSGRRMRMGSGLILS